MIYTITLNPSLDYFVTVEHFEPGRTNRAVTEQILPGGKGLNVSVMLKNLGMDSTALGFTAGFAPQMLPAMIVSKLVGGVSAVVVALLLTKKNITVDKNR